MSRLRTTPSGDRSDGSADANGADETHPQIWRDDIHPPEAASGTDDASPPGETLSRAVRATRAVIRGVEPYRSQGPLDHAESCDVLIIGAGISGAFVAQHLAAAGVDVVVVDRTQPADGATGQSTALVQYELDLPLVELIPRLGIADAQAVYRQARTALDDLRELVDGRSLDCDLTERASIYLAREPADAGHLQHESMARQQIGIAAPFLDAQALADAYGIDRPGGLRSPLAYELDPRKLTHALLADAIGYGARVYEQTSVHADPWVGGVPALRTGDGHSIHCDHVVYATGYAAAKQFPALAPLCDVRTTFSAILRPNEDEPSRWWRGERPILWEVGDPYFYARSTPTGQLIIGGEDVPQLNQAEGEAAIREKTRAMLRSLEQITGIRQVEVEQSFSATFVQTADGLPYIGSPDCSDRCIFVLGYGGNGMLFSLMAGQILRERLMGRAHPAERLFSFQRRSARPVSDRISLGSCP